MAQVEIGKAILFGLRDMDLLQIGCVISPEGEYINLDGEFHLLLFNPYGAKYEIVYNIFSCVETGSLSFRLTAVDSARYLEEQLL